MEAKQLVVQRREETIKEHEEPPLQGQQQAGQEWMSEGRVMQLGVMSDGLSSLSTVH
jgi:hypothetical protein